MWTALLPMGLPALFGTPAGVYLATAIRGWELGWNGLAVPALVLVAVAGAAVSRARGRAAAEVKTLTGPLPAEVRSRLARRAFPASWRLRAPTSGQAGLTAALAAAAAAILAGGSTLLRRRWRVPLRLGA